MSATLNYLLAPNPPTNRGQACRLSADAKGEHIVYANGKSIFVRQVAHPEIAWEYIGHTARTTVARFAPSGYYVASGDAQGTVRIWDATQDEHLLKKEVPVVSGPVHDIAWDAESKRIMAVGEGKDRFGHVFMFDSGNSVGEVSGHSKAINACTMRPSGRPFRAATASDDGTVVFYHGAPYKLQRSIQDHSGFVNDVRYGNSGEHFVSVGADKKVFLYDGKTGELVSTFTDGKDKTTAHSGSIYSVTWSPDSRRFATSSGDCCVKIWDVETQAVVQNFTFDHYNDFRDQQVGNIWVGDSLISLGLSGDLFYLDPASQQSRVARTLQGHQRGITASAITPENTLFTGSYDGRVYSWDGVDQEIHTPQSVQGGCHTSQVMDMASQAGQVVTVGMDDTARTLEIKTKTYEPCTVPLQMQPKQVAALSDGRTLVIGQKDEVLLLGKQGTSTTVLALDLTPTALDSSPTGEHVLLGFSNGTSRLYSLRDGSLVKTHSLDDGRYPITRVRLSPDGQLAAVANTQGKIMAYSTTDGSLKISQWVFHTARVDALEWRGDSLYLASGSLDSNVYVWSVEKPLKRITLKGAHLGGVTGVHFAGDHRLVTTGTNAAVKVWTLEYPC
ncbi:WD40 repeat-like protein [Dispira parvispora]|uniref:WD40 repeat-like protein n=1 Tax=Dispira parvispora TaxID=1520584 RepID=A0A9W8AJM7_9FUNG|nr:WD40 repeat-like protein [Dispira parvispora]